MVANDAQFEPSAQQIRDRALLLATLIAEADNGAYHDKLAAYLKVKLRIWGEIGRSIDGSQRLIDTMDTLVQAMAYSDLIQGLPVPTQVDASFDQRLKIVAEAIIQLSEAQHAR